MNWGRWGLLGGFLTGFPQLAFYECTPSDFSGATQLGGRLAGCVCASLLVRGRGVKVMERRHRWAIGSLSMIRATSEPGFSSGKLGGLCGLLRKRWEICVHH